MQRYTNRWHVLSLHWLMQLPWRSIVSSCDRLKLTAGFRLACRSLKYTEHTKLFINAFNAANQIPFQLTTFVCCIQIYFAASTVAVENIAICVSVCLSVCLSLYVCLSAHISQRTHVQT